MLVCVCQKHKWHGLVPLSPTCLSVQISCFARANKSFSPDVLLTSYARRPGGASPIFGTLSRLNFTTLAGFYFHDNSFIVIIYMSYCFKNRNVIRIGIFPLLYSLGCTLGCTNCMLQRGCAFELERQTGEVTAGGWASNKLFIAFVSMGVCVTLCLCASCGNATRRVCWIWLRP